MEDDLDDLFGDTAPLPILAPVSAPLVQRLNESAFGACCQKVAWARSGVISHIVNNASTIALQHLLCDPENGQWHLSQQFVISEVARTHGDVPLVHLAWDQGGQFLAVCDDHGRLSVWNLRFAVNRLSMTRSCTLDPDDDLSYPLAVVWLQINQGERSQSYYYDPAVRDSKTGQWFLNMTSQVSYGPKHPQNRPTLVVITRAGVAKVLYLDKENRWHDLRQELEPRAIHGRLLTQAAMCVDRTNGSDAMLLATHNHFNELRAYRVRIDFENGNIITRHLASMSQSNPISRASESTDFADDFSTRDVHLNRLDFIPSSPETKGRPKTPPFILTTYSSVSSHLHDTDTVETHVLAWTLSPRKTSILPSLSQLHPEISSEKIASRLPSTFQLLRASHFATSKILLSLQEVNVSTVLVFAWSDGSVELRESPSLELVPPDPVDQISGLSQIGFSFPSHQPCVQKAVSPNSCAMFTVDDTNRTGVTFLQYLRPDTGARTLDEVTLGTIHEAFAVQFAIASRAQFADDILATLQLFSNEFLAPPMQAGFMQSPENRISFQHLLIGGIYRNTNIDDFLVEQADHISRNVYLSRCLGFQQAIGFQGNSIPRPIEGIFATLLLQCRYVNLILMNLLPKKKDESNPEFKKPDMAAFTIPIVRWLLCLFCYIMDELLATRNAFEDAGILPDHLDANLINQHIQQTQSPAILLVLSSLSRAMMKTSFSILRSLRIESEKLRQTNSPNLKTVIQELYQLIRSSPVSIEQFDMVLTQVHNDVKKTFKGLGKDVAEPRMAEMNALTKAQISPLFVGPVKVLIFDVLATAKEKINEAELHFMDIGQLGLVLDEYTGRQVRLHPMDAITKRRLREDAKLARCPKCCLMTEDYVYQKAPNAITYTLGRSCPCGSTWTALSEGDGDQVNL